MKYLLYLISSVFGATEYLARNMKLKWYFPAEDTVTFEWWVPYKTMAPYDWLGVALQDPKDPRDNFRCDYYIVFKENGGQLTDRYAEVSGLPPLDEDQGGTNDLETYRISSDRHEIFVFTRKLDTGDPFDVTLYKGYPTMIKWALSNFDEEGGIQQHTMDDMGFEYFVLDDYYEDRNHDERGKYGPWESTSPNQFMSGND